MPQDYALPELPPLADDGALADVDDGFQPDDSEHVIDDRASHDLALGVLIDVLGDEGSSALDDRSSDIENDTIETNEPESGWLDDAPMEVDLGMRFDTDESASAANDSGQDGLDEAPRRIADGADDDAPGLPAIAPGSDGDGIDEPVTGAVVGDD